MCNSKDAPVKVNIGTFFVDDDQSVHEIIEIMLREIGWTNYEFHEDPEEFLQDLDSNVNIIVVDHRLNAGLDGFQVLKKVKERNKWSFVIVFSGQEDKRVVVDYLNAGADRYVDKTRKNPSEYLDELIDRLKEGFEIAKERVKIVQFLKQAKD